VRVTPGRTAAPVRSALTTHAARLSTYALNRTPVFILTPDFPSDGINDF